MIASVRVRRALFAALIVSAAATSAAAAAQGPSKWFRYVAGTEETWTIAEVPGNPMQFEIARKKSEGISPQHVLVLYPRASSAYDIAISKILQVLDSKDVDAHVTVMNFGMKDDAGQAAIRFAEQHNFDLIFAMGSE